MRGHENGFLASKASRFLPRHLHGSVGGQAASHGKSDSNASCSPGDTSEFQCFPCRDVSASLDLWRIIIMHQMMMS
jgi:hypothetical protein